MSYGSEISRSAQVFLITWLMFSTCCDYNTGVDAKSFTPVLDSNRRILCATDTPSVVLPLSTVSVGIPFGVPGSVICGHSCAGYDGCTSYNYMQKSSSSSSAWCELYNYPLKHCSFTTEITLCQHYEVSGLQPPSCGPIDGGWNSWVALDGCSTIGQRKRYLVRKCDKPFPFLGGSLCINSTGGPAAVEYKNESCAYECDKHCLTKKCDQNGFRTCDGNCTTFYGNNVTSHTCQACNTIGCDDSCNRFGPGTCDGNCIPGYTFQPETFTCLVFPYTTIGCYEDHRWIRDLSGPSVTNVNSYLMTLPMCAQYCYNQGYPFAGVQTDYSFFSYGSICRCGQSYGFYGNSTGCDDECSGNPSLTCGGYHANTVMEYETCSVWCNSTCFNIEYMGCNWTCIAGYGFDNELQTCQSCNSPNCIGSCNVYGPGTCDGPCIFGYIVDSTTHQCTLFQFEVVGCYYDGYGVMYGAGLQSPHMTLASCAQFCHQQDYHYAGVKYGYICQCGDYYDIYGASNTCTKTCAGNSSQICGGSWSNTIVAFACDPNCANPADCIERGLGKCDTECKPGWNMSMWHTCKRCPPGYKYLFDVDNCYMLNGYSKAPHATAVSDCDRVNGNTTAYDVHLAYIETQHEFDVIVNFIGNNSCPVLIGGCRENAGQYSNIIWARSCDSGSTSTSYPPALNTETYDVTTTTSQSFNETDYNDIFTTASDPPDECVAIGDCSNNSSSSNDDQYVNVSCQDEYYYLCEVEV